MGQVVHENGKVLLQAVLEVSGAGMGGCTGRDAGAASTELSSVPWCMV